MTNQPDFTDEMKVLQSGANTFLTGPAGSGKTLLLKQFIKWAWRRYGRESVAITSTTGISASHLGGTTIHSWAGIGLGKKPAHELLADIVDKKQKVKRWRLARILIIDEISMMSAELFEKLETIARQILFSNAPFGGLQVIVSGDFFQLPPVNAWEFCFESPTWERVISKVVQLRTVLRQEDPVLIEALQAVRRGDSDDPRVAAAFAECVGRVQTNEYGIEPTILYSTNNVVNGINQKRLTALIEDGAETREYEATVKFPAGFRLSKPIKEYLRQRADNECPAANYLQLAVGCQVMINANFHSLRLYNGTRGVIVGFNESGWPTVQTLSGRKYTFGPHTWKFEGERKDMVVIKKQIPLRLAFAITVHRSQGMTLDCVQTTIDETIFEYGQAYTALSRCRTLEGLTLDVFEAASIRAHPKVVEYYNNLDGVQTEPGDDHTLVGDADLDSPPSYEESEPIIVL